MSFHVDYRPQTWDEVVGQDAVVSSLRGMVKKKGANAFLLSGPSGVGKTTLARIACQQLGCAPHTGILEIDGATYTGIDEMRKVQEMLIYVPFGEQKGRGIIIDECHRLSRQAWDSLLKVVEEPPPNVYWFFCTTELGRVPQTIKTRCMSFALGEVSKEDLRELVEDVTKVEQITLAEGVMSLIIKEARGSPRQALVNLALVQLCKDRRSAATILQSVYDTDPILQFCQFVANGKGSWQKAMAIMGKLENENPEGIRISVVNYMAKALQGTTNERQACHYLRLLELFSHSYNPSEGRAPLLLSLGQAIYGGDE